MADRLFGASLAPHRPTLLRFAATLVPVDDVEDLVQDALSRAWQKREKFDAARGSLRSWLLAIVADQARSRWRRLTVSIAVNLPEIPSSPPSTETRVDVRRAVAELPGRQRTAVVLFYYVDLSVEDVAAVMRCSNGTVKSTLHDARLRLSRVLGSFYVGN